MAALLREVNKNNILGGQLSILSALNLNHVFSLKTLRNVVPKIQFYHWLITIGFHEQKFGCVMCVVKV